MPDIYNLHMLAAAAPKSPPTMSGYFLADRTDLATYLESVGRFKRALDIGCAAGLLGESLLLSGVVTEGCDGVEMEVQAVTAATTCLGRVWHGNIESILDDLPWHEYDLVIMADVLEHLADPWLLLENLRRRCKPGTRLIASVPNIRHKSVLLPLLLFGTFRYQNAGIMDRTHLHFFTRSSLIEIFTVSGWQVQDIQPNIKRKYLKWWYPHRMLAEFIAVQYFIFASL